MSGQLSGFDYHVFCRDVFLVLRKEYAAYGFVYYLSNAFAEVVYIDHAATVVYVGEYKGVLREFEQFREVAFAAGALVYGWAHYLDNQIIVRYLLDR
mgnify:CR=1 FL=1